MFSFDNNSWFEVASYPWQEWIDHTTIVYVKDAFYTFGGNVQSGFSSDIGKYEPSSNQWTLAGSLQVCFTQNFEENSRLKN